MTAEQIVNMALSYIGKPKAWLANELGQSSQAFGQRLKCGKFSPEEWSAIAQKLGAESHVIRLVFPDGTEIK